MTITASTRKLTVTTAFAAFTAVEHATAELATHAVFASGWDAAARIPDLERLTERQRARISQIIDEVVIVHDVELFRASEIAFRFQNEVRPGRGRDVSFMFADSDHIVTGFLDVYGNGPMSVGDVSWTHNDADDDCQCGRGPCALDCSGE